MEAITKFRTLTVALLVFALSGCKTATTFSITPIDKAFNAKLLNGKDLDKSFFSSSDLLQYYEVSGQNGLSETELLTRLDQYVAAHYKLDTLKNMKTLSIFFYEKTTFSDYSKSIYRDVRESENGSLPDQKDHLIALFSYKRLLGEQGGIQRNRFVYKDTKNVIDKTDTIASSVEAIEPNASPQVEAQAAVSPIADDWFGKYETYFSYGEIGGINAGWTLKLVVDRDSIKASGDGYQMYFEDQLTARENGDTLLLTHLKNLNGYKHGDQMKPEFKLLRKDGKFFIKSDWIGLDVQEQPTADGYPIDKGN